MPSGQRRRIDTGLPPPQAPDIPADVEDRWPELRRVGDTQPLGDYLSQVWKRREFLFSVPKAELRARNQDSVLGQLWHLLNPLLLIAVYYLIFGVMLQVEERRGVEHYLPFLIVGVIAYNYTRASGQAGARAMLKNRKLMQSMNFPRAVLPLSALVSETLAFLYAVPVMLLLVMVVDGGPMPMASWLLLVPALAVQAMFNLGLLMIIARLTFHFRDVQQFLPYALRLLLYASGVLIPINADLIPNTTLLFILQANPVFNLLEMTRGAVLYGTFDLAVWASGVIWSLVVLAVGFWFFRRAENEYGNV